MEEEEEEGAVVHSYTLLCFAKYVHISPFGRELFSVIK